VAKAKGETPHDVTVVILDRPRHADLIAQVRETGASAGSSRAKLRAYSAVNFG